MFEAGLHLMAGPTMGTGKKRTGTPYLYIEGEITHCLDAAGQPVQVPSPGKRTVFLYVSDAAFPMSMDKLEPFGFNGDMHNPELGHEQQEKGIWVECKHETYDGKPVAKWELPGGEMQHAELGQDDIRRLTALLANRNRASGVAPVPPVPGSEMPPPPSDDDIPF